MPDTSDKVVHRRDGGVGLELSKRRSHPLVFPFDLANRNGPCSSAEDGRIKKIKERKKKHRDGWRLSFGGPGPPLSIFLKE